MLKDQIKADTTEALKAKNETVVGTLRMLLASVLTKEKEKQYKTSEANAQLTDQEVLDTITSEIKKRKDAIALYTQGARPELAEKEQKEIDILMKYLPEQLSGEEIKNLVKEAIEKTGAKEMKDMGKVMAELNPKVKGRADGGEVSKVVKELLAK